EYQADRVHGLVESSADRLRFVKTADEVAGRPKQAPGRIGALGSPRLTTLINRFVRPWRKGRYFVSVTCGHTQMRRGSTTVNSAVSSTLTCDPATIVPLLSDMTGRASV